MPRKLKLNEDEVIAEEVLKLLGDERLARVAAQLHERRISMRSAAIACGVAARSACAGPAEKVVALALIRLLQFAGSRPSADDVARYENATAPAAEAPAADAAPDEA